MFAIQIILAATTGLFVPPMLTATLTGLEPCVVVVQSASADVTPEDGKTLKVVVVGNCDDQPPQVVESDEIKIVHVVAESDDDDASAADGLANIVVSIAERDIEPGGPWLGIRFGPVPKPLASHLQLEQGIGQMVLNIAEGSPADEAGFEQYDVITNIDGTEATDNVGKFLDTVRDFEPDETHAFSLIRGGRPTQASVTIAERPESIGKMKYKFEVAPDGLSEDNVFFRGGMLQKDDDGVWTFDRLGDLGGLHELRDIWKVMPEVDGDDLNLSIHGKFFPEARQQYKLQLLDEGKCIRMEVTQGDDGQITVTKTTNADGEEKTTTQTYADREAFEKADPESFGGHKDPTIGGAHGRLHKMFLFGDHGKRHGLHDLGDIRDLTLDIDIDTDHLNAAIDELHKQMSSFKESHEIFKKRLYDPFENGKSSGFVEATAESATTRFTVDPTGKITVTIRRGDNELVEKYDAPKQLKKARPDLYKKYKSLVEVKAE